MVNTDVSIRDQLRGSRPSYHELLQENRRLKAEISRHSTATIAGLDQTYGEVLNITESFERDLFQAITETSRITTVTDASDIYWPSPECGSIFLAHGRMWTSWIHCALHHPTFEAECNAFWQSTNVSAQGVGAAEPLWLAVYFSFMSVCLPQNNFEQCINMREI